jgi:hypothetical protein
MEDDLKEMSKNGRRTKKMEDDLKKRWKTTSKKRWKTP